MMFTKQKVPYFKDANLGCAAIQIPYKGGDLAMVVILPDEDFGLENLVNQLTSDRLSHLLKDLQSTFPQEVHTKLPRFKVTSSFGLKEALSSLGMAEAFDMGKADFTGMTDAPEGLVLSDVVHKAFVQVNEEGTEAAAATAAVMMTRCARIPRQPLAFTADHAFLLLIQDLTSGFTLFMGHIVDPSD